MLTADASHTEAEQEAEKEDPKQNYAITPKAYPSTPSSLSQLFGSTTTPIGDQVPKHVSCREPVCLLLGKPAYQTESRQVRVC